MTWRKGCLCGCLYEAECRHIKPTKPPAQVVHVVHHYMAAPDPDVIEAEWVITHPITRD